MLADLSSLALPQDKENLRKQTSIARNKAYMPTVLELASVLEGAAIAGLTVASRRRGQARQGHR